MSELLQYILSSGEQFRRARIPSLYSDLSLQRANNPDGFSANISAWENALRQAAKAGLIPAPGNSRDTLSLRTGEELLQALTTKEWGRPLSLGTVIVGNIAQVRSDLSVSDPALQDEAVERRQFIPRKDFLESPTSVYNRKWAIRPWWLVSWTLHQLGLYEKQAALGKLPKAQYVIVSNVEEAAAQVISRMTGRTNLVDRIYPKHIFAREVSKALGMQSDLTGNDFEVMLRFLARDKGVLAYDDLAVKFKSAGEPLSQLTAEDRTVASLKSLIADLNLQLTALTVRINSLGEKAQLAVKAKNRVAAMAALKSKKAAENTLSQRYEALGQVEGVYGKIEQAADQVALIRVMEASTGVLRNLHAQVGGVERVEDVVDGLRDEMDKVDEIGQVMEEAGRGENAVDEDAIDDELQALELQDRTEREEKEAEQTRRKLAELDEAKPPEALIGPIKEQPEDPVVAAQSQASHNLSSEQLARKAPSQTGNETTSAVAANS
ncbi:MAG: hypothetical protein HETSPECPRED_001944 [Heterodermia speciosa]|uniref:Uncharacterized protein n=1 Tax=Heterodermia speciosa TaxID=116794 RepID=A0A8H3IFV4_9LECA|nr:MAG: hypothetical protein HETSPECPRED_001944 [Heterodermia speciosa]